MLTAWYLCSVLVMFCIIKVKELFGFDDLKKEGFTIFQIKIVLCVFIIASPIIVIVFMVKFLKSRFK